jgi:hypothetical protein
LRVYGHIELIGLAEVDALYADKVVPLRPVSALVAELSMGIGISARRFRAGSGTGSRTPPFA